MAARTAFTLADGQSVPVNHVFDPNGSIAVLKDGTRVIEYVDRSPGVPDGFNRIRLSVQDRGELIKVRVRTTIPTLESLGTTSAGYAAVPSVRYTTTSDCTYFLPKIGLKSNRQDLFAYQKNLIGLLDAQNWLKSMIIDLVEPY